MGAGHAGVDLGHDDRRDLGGRAGDVHRHAEGTEAVAVGGRNLDEGEVERQDPAAEERRHLAQEDRRVVGLARGDGGADVRADEERVGVEARVQRGIGVGRRPLRVKMHELDAAELRRARGEGGNEVLGGGGNRVNEDPLPGPHRRDGLGGVHQPH